MKRTQLFDVLKKTSPALSNKDVIAVFSCFCFGKDSVLAYDDLIAIQFPLKVEGLRGAVKGDVLLRWLGSVKFKDVDVVPGETSVLFKCGRSKIELPLLSKDDFLFKFPTKAARFEFPVDDSVVKLIQQATTSMGTDPSHPWRLGLTLKISPDGLLMYSCDNATATRVSSSKSHKKSFSVIIPPRFCDLLKTFAKDEGKCTLKLSGKWLIADFESGLKLFSRAGASPDIDQYEKLFKGYDAVAPKSYVKLPPPLKNALDRAEVILPYAKEPYTTATVKDGTLSFLTKSDSTGEIKDRMKFEKHAAIELRFLPSRLSRAIHKGVRMCMTEKFIVLRSKGYAHMIAPVII